MAPQLKRRTVLTLHHFISVHVTPLKVQALEPAGPGPVIVLAPVEYQGRGQQTEYTLYLY